MEFHWKLLPNILGIYHGNVTQVFHEHKFALREGSSIEDIQDTSLKHLVRQFGKVQTNAKNLISCLVETPQNASVISTDGVGFESERVSNENETNSDMSPLPYQSSIASDEGGKKLDAPENLSDNDWFIERKFIWKQMLGLVYSLHKFLENRSHQLHCSEYMDKIKELSQVNRNWFKRTNLNNLSWKDMRETMKVMSFESFL